MAQVRWLTGGESHGPGLSGILEGLPAGVAIDWERVNRDLLRRQGGYGRGPRMKIEADTVQCLGGVRKGRTTGGPIVLLIANRDWENWEAIMTPEVAENGSVTTAKGHEEQVDIPRPGHADFAGKLKYRHTTIRDVIERASARETAQRVALGSLAQQFLEACGVSFAGHVLSIGCVHAKPVSLSLQEIRDLSEASEVRCIDADASGAMKREIHAAANRGDTLGGVFQVLAEGLPVGLGSMTQWDLRLDARIAKAMMSIQAIKGVEIGLGFEGARRPGSQVHDSFFLDGKGGLHRGENHAGGLEGGMTNGAPIVVQAAMKPISTLKSPLQSFRFETGEPCESRHERSDVCAVPAAAVVGEAMLALVLLEAFREKFGGDSLEEVLGQLEEVRAAGPFQFPPYPWKRE